MSPTPVILRSVVLNEPASSWAAAMSAHGWSGAAIIPPVLGTNGTPPPIGGDYEMVDPAFGLMRELVGRDDEQLLLVGLGSAGWSASIFAIAGRVDALILVDGLGGPFVDPTWWPDARRAMLRTIFERPELLGPAPAGVADDPRASFVRSGHGDIDLAIEGARATVVPTLVLESPASGTTVPEAQQVVSEFADATLVKIEDTSASTIIAAVDEWRSARSL